jgi:hypothetical protein
MIDLTYYSKEHVSLDTVLNIALETGLIVQFVEDYDKLQIEIEPRTIVHWGSSAREIFEDSEREYLLQNRIQTVHLISLHYNIAPKLRGFLSVLFSRYDGWIVDDETPNFSPETKGRVDIYNRENVDEFLKTLTNPS